MFSTAVAIALALKLARRTSAQQLRFCLAPARNYMQLTASLCHTGASVNVQPAFTFTWLAFKYLAAVPAERPLVQLFRSQVSGGHGYAHSVLHCAVLLVLPCHLAHKRSAAAAWHLQSAGPSARILHLLMFMTIYRE